MSQYYEDELEHEARPSLWARIRGWAFPREQEEEEVAPAPRATDTTVRYKKLYPYHIVIRQEVHTLEDARVVADGLKEGVQQVINLASTAQGMRERIIDFLNGVTYAIEGSVERVSEHVFLYAPPQAIVEPQSGSRTRTDERR